MPVDGVMYVTYDGDIQAGWDFGAATTESKYAHPFVSVSYRTMGGHSEPFISVIVSLVNKLEAYLVSNEHHLANGPHGLET